MKLTRLENTLREAGISDAINRVCAGETECYLVGGAIRDSLLGRALNDFDFCFPANPSDYAGRIAEALGATFFILDEERGHSRFVLKRDDRKLTCDFAPFRAPSLKSDLHKRDFTINALAVACRPDAFSLIDPLNGRDDLAAKRLRACSEYSFHDDPLRCLKGIRHAVSLEFEFEPATFNHLIEAVPQIDQVASERIRTELARAVASKHPVRAFELLGSTGLHRELFGPSSPEAFINALDMVRELVAVFKALKSGVCGQVVSDYLEEPCEENVSIGVALMLAAFFYGYRPVALNSVLAALRFSKRTINLIGQLQKLDDKTNVSFARVADKARSRARWLSGLGQEPIASAVFLPLVTPETDRDNLLRTELLIDSFCASSVEGKLVELVDGTWLAKEMGIAEGPVIGRLQALVHQAEISGEATTTAEARQWLRTNQKSVDNIFEQNL